jgi:acetolactate synthase-1/2/3 large subunit
MAKQQNIEKPRAEWGSDVIVDAIKAFDIEYIAINPGATFRGLHDSLVNYGGNHAPEIILCNHEEIAVALAQPCASQGANGGSGAQRRRLRTRRWRSTMPGPTGCR